MRSARSVALALAVLAVCRRPGDAPRRLPTSSSASLPARSACGAAGCSPARTASSSHSSRISSRWTARISTRPPLAWTSNSPSRPRASVVVGFDFSQGRARIRSIAISSTISGCPITQTTRLREMNMSGSVKFALTPRGREISSRAWIPAAVTPYVGAGGGLLRYEFLQYGDFIDVDDGAWRLPRYLPLRRVGAERARVRRRRREGVEAAVSQRRGALSLVEGDARSRLFGFDPIDLAGFKATVGIHYMF